MSVHEPIIHHCDNDGCESVISQLYGTAFIGWRWAIQEGQHAVEFCSFSCLKAWVINKSAQERSIIHEAVRRARED